MASSAFVERLNEQIGHELGAHNQYLALAVYYDAETLPRLASFFYAQALEERGHAMMMVRYLLDADAEAVIPAVTAPQTSFADVVAPVALALEQERRVTDQINELAALARRDSDLSSEQFMQWFIKEQVEEVATMSDLLAGGGAGQARTRCRPRSTWPARAWATAATTPPRPRPPAGST